MRFALLALLASAAAIAVPQAMACTCQCTPGSAEKWIDGAAYVFRGDVVGVVGVQKGKDDMAEEIFTMRPTKILKGAPASELKLVSPPSGGMCGVGFLKGETRDVLAIRSDDGKLRVHICANFCAGQDGVFKQLGDPIR